MSLPYPVRLALAAFVLTSTAFAQEAAPHTPVCPTREPVRLAQVIALIHNHISDDKIAEIVASCHVAFAMDPAAVEELAAAGATPPVLDALDRDTISRMQASQAHSEVAALESRKQANQSSANPARDAALRQLDADYKLQRDKAAIIQPRGEFETTAQYNERVKTTNDALAGMDRDHEAERTRLAEKFATDVAAKNQPLDRRIAVLKRALFPIAGAAPVWIAYDANIPRLAASAAGQEYWFSAEPHRAQALKEHWSSVRLHERYEDDASRTRYLAELGSIEPVPGILRATEEAREAAATELKAAADARAAAQAQAAADARNKAIAEATALRQREEELARNPKLIPGTWYDAATKLLWTESDNGKSVTWEEAKSYCSQQSFSGSSGWRMPTFSELSRMYDPSQKTRVPVRGGLAAFYYIKGNINLTDLFEIWSSSTGAGGLTAMVKAFWNNASEFVNIRNTTPRALCVGSIQLPAASASQSTSSLAPAGADGSTLALQGEWRGTLYVPSGNLPIVFQIDAGGSGTAISPAQDVTAPFQYSTNGNRITITASSPKLAGGSGSYAATVNGDQMTGTWSQSGKNLPLTVNRAGASQVAAPVPQTARPSDPFSPTVLAIQIEGSVQQAKLIKKAAPVYPPLARAARVEGTVQLRTTIGPDGHVTNVHSLGGPPQLVPAAVQAVFQYQYEPTLLNGKPVPVVTTVDVNFTLTQ